MGRFNNARAAALAPVIEPAPAAPIVVSGFAHDSSLVQRAGLAPLCPFTISAYANEFATRIFHVKAYVSTVSWVLLPLLLIGSGNISRRFAIASHGFGRYFWYGCWSQRLLASGGRIDCAFAGQCPARLDSVFLFRRLRQFVETSAAADVLSCYGRTFCFCSTASEPDRWRTVVSKFPTACSFGMRTT